MPPAQISNSPVRAGQRPAGPGLAAVPNDAAARHAVPWEAVTPPKIPGLSVVRLLGVGAQAAVWLVRPAVSRRRRTDAAVVWVTGGEQVPAQLAWKVPLARPRGVTSLGSCRQELEAMLPLRHEHLVRAWGITRSGGTPGVLLDAYAAGSLAQLLRSAGRLDPGELVTALTPVASALQHLHHQGANHGDVSAANILLSVDGRPALADLGEAALLGTESRHGSTAADVAGLACVAWEALTGRQPDPGLRRAPLGALRPDVPLGLVTLLEEAMSTAAAERPTAEEFAAELYACAAPAALQLADHVDDEALAELPTQLPERREPGPPRWTGLFRRIRAGKAQRPSWASKLPSSRRAFRVWRKRPASAPSTIR